jgi:hypothetical protein
VTAAVSYVTLDGNKDSTSKCPRKPRWQRHVNTGSCRLHNQALVILTTREYNRNNTPFPQAQMPHNEPSKASAWAHGALASAPLCGVWGTLSGYTQAQLHHQAMTMVRGGIRRLQRTSIRHDHTAALQESTTGDSCPVKQQNHRFEHCCPAACAGKTQD